MRNVLKRTDKYFWFATAIIAAGCAVRLFALGSIPCGLNQDEAFAGYNAWALLHYGVDSSGYHNPVYFTAWGSGMNGTGKLFNDSFCCAVWHRHGRPSASSGSHGMLVPDLRL